MNSNHAVTFFFSSILQIQIQMICFRLVYNECSSFLQICMIIAHFACMMCKMACKATNGIYGVQSYKCDEDVYPTHIIFNFLNIL